MLVLTDGGFGERATGHGLRYKRVSGYLVSVQQSATHKH